jgi:multiple sugar transport system permease protein
MIFFPYLLTVSIVGIVWRWMLQRNYGLVNYYLGKMGIAPLGWLAEARTAMPSIALATIWWTIGFNLVVFLAALQDIPEELYEAARIDGAGPVKSFLRITVPLVRPTTIFVVIMQVIASFQVFGQVFVMTGGGPYGSTRTVVQYLYEQGFRYFRMGYASAIAYVLFFIMFVLTIVQWRVMGRREL